jgi:ankyrin repeat protein
MRLKQIVGSGLVALLVASQADSPRAAGVAPVALIDAIKKHDVATVRTLLKQPTAATAVTADGTTPLHWATDLDDLAIAELLVRAGASVTAANRYGVTPMYSAAVNGNAKMIELLLGAGADPNVALPEGETALMTVSKTGKVDAMRVLLAHGATVNVKEKWKQQSALMWARTRAMPKPSSCSSKPAHTSTSDPCSDGRRCCSPLARVRSRRLKHSLPAVRTSTTRCPMAPARS